VYQNHAELGMTPRAYRDGGRGTTIEWAITATPLGSLLVAATPRGICSVRFGQSPAALERELATEFPDATLAPAGPRLDAAVRAVHAAAAGERFDPALPLDVHATAFQRRVWRALQAIPAGTTRSYGEIARRIGRPGAARAVGRACASNRVALLIPCHRAVRASGAPGDYAWGPERKRRLLELESARRQR